MEYYGTYRKVTEHHGRVWNMIECDRTWQNVTELDGRWWNILGQVIARHMEEVVT